MPTRNWIWRGLAALLLAAILTAGGLALFRMGLAQGYLAGGAAAGAAGEGGAAGAAPYGYPAYGWGFRGPFFGPPMGFFFGPWLCLFGFALFFLLGGFFRFWGRGHWHGRPFGRHGPYAWDDPHGQQMHMHPHTHPHTHEPAEGQEPPQDADQ
jgi:hypothetical protein